MAVNAEPAAPAAQAQPGVSAPAAIALTPTPTPPGAVPPAAPPTETPTVPPGSLTPEQIAELQARVAKLGFADLSDLLKQLETEINNPSPPQETPPMATTSPPPAAPAAPSAPAAAPATPATPPIAAAPIGAPPSTPAAPVAAAAAAAADDPVNDRRIPDATRRRLNKLREDMRARADAAEQQATQHQQQVTTLQGQLRAAQEAEKLKIAMVRAGVQEVDFAWHLLSAELAAMRDSQDPAVKEQLAKFDVATWAANLKATRPYLFGVQPVPATSPAQPHAPAPAAQAPGAVTGQAAAAGAVDLRKATPEQVKERLAQHGIQYNRRGRPFG